MCLTSWLLPACRCLMSLLALVLIGIVVLIALKATGVVGKSVKIPYPTVTVTAAPPQCIAHCGPRR